MGDLGGGSSLGRTDCRRTSGVSVDVVIMITWSRLWRRRYCGWSSCSPLSCRWRWGTGRRSYRDQRRGRAQGWSHARVGGRGWCAAWRCARDSRSAAWWNVRDGQSDAGCGQNYARCGIGAREGGCGASCGAGISLGRGPSWARARRPGLGSPGGVREVSPGLVRAVLPGWASVASPGSAWALWAGLAWVAWATLMRTVRATWSWRVSAGRPCRLCRPSGSRPGWIAFCRDGRGRSVPW